jgi:hypothetical protein
MYEPALCAGRKHSVDWVRLVMIEWRIVPDVHYGVKSFVAIDAENFQPYTPPQQ